jgi:hypothetical protein
MLPRLACPPLQPLHVLLMMFAEWANRHQLDRPQVLNDLETLITPNTLLRWHRELVALKWNYSQRRRPGRPCTMQTIVDLILRMALENRS